MLPNDVREQGVAVHGSRVKTVSYDMTDRALP